MRSIKSVFLVIARISACALALGAPSITAAQPPAEIRDLLGHYRVLDGRSRQLCTVRLLWEKDVGGEVDGANCERALPPLSDALRFHPQKNDGEFVLEDALHHTVGRIVEDEAGLSFRSADGREYALEPLVAAKLLTPTQRATGRWRVARSRGAALKPDCRVRLHQGGLVEVAKSCPADWRAFAGARWSSTAHWLTIRRGPSSLAFDWTGGDGTDVSTADGKWTLYLIDR